MKSEALSLKAIGVIHSPFIDKFGTPRQSQIAKSTTSELLFEKKIVTSPMLDGFKVGDPIWVIFGFHLNNQKKPIAKVHPPRLKGKKIGVLASRSPHRPNPIGLSIGFITKITNTSLFVSGLDIVHGTPVYDIKPYLPEFDRPKNKKAADWVRKNPFTKLKVRFTTEIALPAKEKAELKKCLREILSEDPRPLAYFSKPDHQYWMKYQKWDVGFTISDPYLNVNKFVGIAD
ncbi:MAG: tRNA (N6-threonylcarbamoyladenosine(37)-N6)-methyltransferase TrmO [Bdellovibrionaceae bacterium]|nr:tRNA (N6-threonylcarbamoyladenosine(37)-N6)-methyltransferase TrmO [Pseudobdellovibrionaceae bacterium]